MGTRSGCKVCLLCLFRAGWVSLLCERDEGARHSKLGGACIGEVVEADEFGSMLTKLYVVGVLLVVAGLALIGLRSWLSRESDALRVGPSLASFCLLFVFVSSSSIL